MFNVRLAGGHLYGKQLFTWLSLVVSLMASFVLSFFPLDVLDEIWDLIESVSEGFLTYSRLGKCLDRIVTVRLNRFIEHNKIIDQEQEGFRKFHSTTHALMRLVQDIYNGFNNKKKSLVAFIDMEKAFDSV